jgi:hypothetical protein
VSREHIEEHRCIPLNRSERYIHVVGAVSDGECALFDTEAWTVERIRIPR